MCFFYFYFFYKFSWSKKFKYPPGLRYIALPCTALTWKSLHSNLLRYTILKQSTNTRPVPKQETKVMVQADLHNFISFTPPGF